MLSTSAILKQSSQLVIDKVMRHPFIKEIQRGDLDREIFYYYLQQDGIYLLDFSRALAITASKMNKTADYLKFLQFAYDAVISEHSIQIDYLDKHNVKSRDKLTPSCFAYTHFLLTTAKIESVLYSVAALLPCFYIYAEVASNIGVLASDNHFQFWVDIYRDDAFIEQVRYLFDWMDDCDNGEIDKLKSFFLRSMYYELQFWDDAYYMRSL